ncbi:GNAT family N-acetyltransferase [Guyparkeria sp.]|uniref:GNAT family N-acetyltransferase n=1 Tax=Guyparkeria sp. TaxID=2035736 RepID=UPI003970FB53
MSHGRTGGNSAAQRPDPGRLPATVYVSPDRPWFRLEPVVESRLPLVAALAESIWWKCYPPIIGAEQVHYMLGRGYSLPSLRRQARAGARFLLLRAGPHSIGFLAWQPANGEAFLDKLYLEPDYHGLGLGRMMLAAVAHAATVAGLDAVSLRVNRDNRSAIRAYRRAGFEVVAEDVKRIGGGFVMDDYLMRLNLDCFRLIESTDSRSLWSGRQCSQPWR